MAGLFLAHCRQEMRTRQVRSLAMKNGAKQLTFSPEEQKYIVDEASGGK